MAIRCDSGKLLTQERTGFDVFTIYKKSAPDLATVVDTTQGVNVEPQVWQVATNPGRF